MIERDMANYCKDCVDFHPYIGELGECLTSNARIDNERRRESSRPACKRFRPKNIEERNAVYQNALKDGKRAYATEICKLLNEEIDNFKDSSPEYADGLRHAIDVVKEVQMDDTGNLDSRYDYSWMGSI